MFFLYGVRELAPALHKEATMYYGFMDFIILGGILFLLLYLGHLYTLERINKSIQRLIKTIEQKRQQPPNPKP